NRPGARPAAGAAAAAAAAAAAGQTPDPNAAPTGAAPTPGAPPGATPATPPGGGGTTTTGTKPAATGPNGKARGDTTNLSQFESGMEFEPAKPGEKFAFALEDADLPELVRTVSNLTGKRFIFGGKVKNIKATVYSPQKVSVAEIYQAFLSI